MFFHLKRKVFPVDSFLLFFGGEKSVDGCVDGIGSVSRNCSDREEVEADLSDDVTACCIFLPSFCQPTINIRGR